MTPPVPLPPPLPGAPAASLAAADERGVLGVCGDETKAPAGPDDDCSREGNVTEIPVVLAAPLVWPINRCTTSRVDGGAFFNASASRSVGLPVGSPSSRSWSSSTTLPWSEGLLCNRSLGGGDAPVRRAIAGDMSTVAGVGGSGALEGELPFDEAPVVGIRVRAGPSGVRGEAAPVKLAELAVVVALAGDAGR